MEKGECGMSNCPHEVEFAEKLATVDQRSKSNTRRLDDLDAWKKDQTELISSVASLANEQKNIKTDVEEIKVDVKAIAEKPGKRWDAVVDKAVWAVCAAVIAFLLGRLGL
jgi:predicted ribosome quality control (RQC) complex YloA/Tae2 family protein